MVNIKLSTTEARHNRIREEYDKLMKELGEEAPYITRTRIYDLLSERVNYSPALCMRVVNSQQEKK